MPDGHADAQAQPAASLPICAASRRAVVVDRDHVHALVFQRAEVARQGGDEGLAFAVRISRSYPCAAPCRRSAARRSGACRARGRWLAAHREGLGQHLVQRFAVGDAPSVPGSWPGFGVDNACICGSNALIFLTTTPSCLMRRSLRLPKTLVSRRLSMVYRKVDGAGRAAGGSMKRAHGALLCNAHCTVEAPAFTRVRAAHPALYATLVRFPERSRLPLTAAWPRSRPELARVVDAAVLQTSKCTCAGGVAGGTALATSWLVRTRSLTFTVLRDCARSGDEAAAVVDLDHVAAARAPAE